MAVANKDIDSLLAIILLYLPSAPARQLLGDLHRSRMAEANASFKETINRLIKALDQRVGGKVGTYTPGA